MIIDFLFGCRKFWNNIASNLGGSQSGEGKRKQSTRAPCQCQSDGALIMFICICICRYILYIFIYVPKHLTISLVVLIIGKSFRRCDNQDVGFTGPRIKGLVEGCVHRGFMECSAISPWSWVMKGGAELLQFPLPSHVHPPPFFSLLAKLSP